MKQNADGFEPDRTIFPGGAQIIVGENPHETRQYAAAELARFLYLLTHRTSPVSSTIVDGAGCCILLDPECVCEFGEGGAPGEFGEQGYRVRAGRRGEMDYVAVAADTPVGTLYGVYALLEELGMGFYAGGETMPDPAMPIAVPRDLELCGKPVFRVRGNMLHYNFLCGPTAWGLEDYHFYFDQLARMRCNMLLMHWYDGEPGAAYEVNGEYLAGGPTPNSLSRPWGALDALRTSQFYFESGRYFPREVFTSPMAGQNADLLSEVRASEEMWLQATAYARRAGIGVAAGFEAPRTDPTDPQEMSQFRARMRQFLGRNPHLTHFALWQHESGACYGTTPPKPGTSAGDLMDEERERFAYLGNGRRIWEAIRYGAFAREAAALLEQERPELRLVVVGWGGNRWMRFADLCLGYHQFLPESVIFTCHDNIDASFGPEVSDAWGKLPPERERWAMPWVEGDIEECWVRQPQVESLGKLAPDALNKGAQGLLTLQWRTRDVEEETGYIARFSWDPNLTPQLFYRQFARAAFGVDQEAFMGEMIGTLQRLGSRWTGVHGSTECARMCWTGHVPHYPFEVSPRAAEYLADLAKNAAESLALVVDVEQEQGGGGAFHQRTGADAAQDVRDATRPGVEELTSAVAQLQALAEASDASGLREAFVEIEEELWPVREKLIRFGMTSRSYRTLDTFLIALHHVQRNAGVADHFARLRECRRKLDRLRRDYERAGRVRRLERLDFLTATMDFVLNFDQVALLLADNEQVDWTLSIAELEKETQNEEAAISAVAEVYASLIAAGMPKAIDALCRKLTTRCDFGVLATVNIKAMPLYWQTFDKLESFLPAVPPREIQIREHAGEAWISWPQSPKAAGLQLYRRFRDEGNWSKCGERLQGTCRMFVDRPEHAGHYEYSLTALDENGWESPRSHSVTVRLGAGAQPPRLAAPKPGGVLAVGMPLDVTVAAVSERKIAEVSLVWRRAGDGRWQRLPMRRCYGDSYGITVRFVENDLPVGTIVEFFVEAIDGAGAMAVWPATASENLPWTVCILPE